MRPERAAAALPGRVGMAPRRARRALPDRAAVPLPRRGHRHRHLHGRHREHHQQDAQGVHGQGAL